MPYREKKRVEKAEGTAALMDFYQTTFNYIVAKLNLPRGIRNADPRMVVNGFAPELRDLDPRKVTLEDLREAYSTLRNRNYPTWLLAKLSTSEGRYRRGY